MEVIDFLEQCRKRYADANETSSKNRDSNESLFKVAEAGRLGQLDASDFVLAAWLYRLGQPELAAKALCKARDQVANPGWKVGNDEAPAGETPDAHLIRSFKDDMAWTAFARMVHAYMVRADEEALTHGERLLRFYPDIVKKDYGQAGQIVDELKRRKGKGTFGKTPADNWPDGSGKWSQSKKLLWLIDSLEEVDERQWGQPGGVPLGRDRRVAALIEIGDPAVPALIDVIEKDDRLTRSVHFWRDFAHSRTVLSVREAALTAVMSILKTQAFEPASTGDNFTSRGTAKAVETARRLRKYWNAYGGLPFDERMMKILTDEKASPAILREAAQNLGFIGISPWRDPSQVFYWFPRAEKVNPAVAKFKNPTTAEAILAAMDRDLAHHDASAPDQFYDYDRNEIETKYVASIITLGDQKVVPTLVARYQIANEARMRRFLAEASYCLDAPQLLNAYFHDVENGLITLPPNGHATFRDDDLPGNKELRRIVTDALSVRSMEALNAVKVMANSRHPFHAMLIDRLINGESWPTDPMLLNTFRQALDDTTPTGSSWWIEGTTLWHGTEKGSCYGTQIPENLRDPNSHFNKVTERVCDKAAKRLAENVFGLPAYCPLRKDAADQLAIIKEALDRYASRFRELTSAEKKALGVSEESRWLVPDITPLERTATQQDVKLGHALFSLDGNGRVAGVKLPAVANRRARGKDEPQVRVLVVQAEIGLGGKAIYGIIESGGICKATDNDLVDIKPIAEPEGSKK